MTRWTQRHKRWDMVATAACLGTLCCWSLGPIFIEQLTHYVDSRTQNALRYSVAFLFWLPLLLHFIHAGKFDQRIWRLALVPAVANVTMQSLWAIIFYYIGPAFATLLSKTNVIWVTTFSLILFADERPLVRSRRFWGGLVLSIAGVLGILLFKEDFAARQTRAGILLALICAFLWGLYALSVKVRLKRVDSRCGLAVVRVHTTGVLWIVALVSGRPAECLEMPLSGWAAVVISGITAIALGHVFFYTAIKRIGATIPSLVILAQPLVVFGLSSMFFHEHLNGPQLLFGLVLLSGAALSIWAQEHVRKGPDEG